MTAVDDVPPGRECPSWCTREHAGTPVAAGEGFHHDGHLIVIPIDCDDCREPGTLLVRPERYQPVEGECAPLVSLDAPGNSGISRVTLLSTGEARSLAAALVTAADQVDGNGAG